MIMVALHTTSVNRPGLVLVETTLAVGFSLNSSIGFCAMSWRKHEKGA